MTQRTSVLRSVVARPGLARAMGAHNALSARVAEQAGFDAIWASGLEISASQGLPDASILTMSDFLAAAAAMAHAVDRPVIADVDAGFGDINNVYRTVQCYEAAGVAAVCIEDKRHPKLNSFVSGSQHLEPVDEFAAKLMAAKAAQRDPDFVVIARIEALVVGASESEALYRASVYEQAGADAILIHSRHPEPTEIFSFREKYDGGLPVVVVPTAFPQVTATDLETRGFALCIYANHGLRSALRAMRRTMAAIARTGTTACVEDRIASLDEVFAVQGIADMLQRQRDYQDAARHLVDTTLEVGAK